LGSTPAPGVAGCALAASLLRALWPGTLETFLCARVFREGAENRARGGRAPWLFRNSGLMEPRDEAIYHDFNLTVHANRRPDHEIFLGLLDERDKAYVENFFRQAKPFYVAADYPLPPGAKV
jgi:hypothetical protein